MRRGKGKMSAKAHLRDLAQRKKARRAEEIDVHPPPESDEEPMEMEKLNLDGAGDAAKRERSASRSRKSYNKRFRGLDQQLAQSMASWLNVVTPAEEVAAAFVESVIEAALQEVKEDVERAEAAAKAAAAKKAAAAEKVRYHEKKQLQTPPPRRCHPRAQRTFSTGMSTGKSTAASAAGSAKRKRNAGTIVTPEMMATLKRISHPKRRRFERGDLMNGEKLSRVEFAQARKDHLELHRVYAMNMYVTQRRAGACARAAYEEASKSVVKPNGKSVNWQTVRRWLRDFAACGGRLQLDQRGRCPTTNSFLSDNTLRQLALEWLREQMRLTRAKNIDSPPLTVTNFHRWINSTLLKSKFEADSRLKPVDAVTALRWLYKLGFQHKSHTKSIYFDGHEREDVVRDRMEKLAMLKALEEVTVTFVGKDCGEVRWPLMHPGEPPVVWISQDESAYHSNDDVKSEWGEEGRGLSIKQKSRGALLMVSIFVSELNGILRCTPAQLNAYVAANPGSAIAAKIAAEPAWDGSSTLILEPGAAPGKDKYFDAEQLHVQTKLAMEIFEATHHAPGRWVYHPSRRGGSSRSTYPSSFTAVWLPPTSCKGLFFYDHSSGHGAYAAEALLASNANKNPDWKGSLKPMRDGWYRNAQGIRGSHRRCNFPKVTSYHVTLLTPQA